MWEAARLLEIDVGMAHTFEIPEQILILDVLLVENWWK